jgi:hypothetical protein
MNYQKKITEIENAQKSLILLKKEVLIAERKSKKLASIDASLSQTEKNWKYSDSLPRLRI